MPSEPSVVSSPDDQHDGFHWLPLAHHLRETDARSKFRDAAAGLNVALLAIPQGMAFAMIAGFAHQASGILASGTAAITILGPTNATALMLFSASAAYGAAGAPAPLLVLLAGLLLAAAAILRLADLLQYVSRSVVVGYVSAAALLIAAGQLRDALGIPPEMRGTSFFGSLGRTVASLPAASPHALAISAASVVIYTLLRRLRPHWPAFAIALAAVSALTALVPEVHRHTLFLDGFQPDELLPDWSKFQWSRLPVWLGALTGPACAIAFIAALETSVMGKSLSGRAGRRANPHQDLLACGLANAACAFSGGMPASGSLTRSTLNFTSGARTPLSALVCGLVCLVAALLLGRVTPHIPRAALAALIICVTPALFSLRHLRICWNATRSDTITLATTFFATLLLPLHTALFIGVAASIALYLRKASRPVLVEYEFNDEGTLRERPEGAGRQHPRISIVHVEGELFFGAAELFRTQIQRTALDPSLRIIILRMRNARHLDATSVMALEDLVRFLRADGRHLLLSGLSKDVYRVLLRSDMVDTIGRENIFIGSASNPNLSTRHALKRAQQLLGTSDAEIQILYNPEAQR
jgi:SulP family sulfate permease